MKLAAIEQERVAWVPDTAQVGQRVFCFLVDEDSFMVEVLARIVEIIPD